MKKQSLTINLDYDLKTLLPAKQLIVDIKSCLETHKVASTILDSVNLDFTRLSIVIESTTPCDDILNLLRPVLEQSNIETQARLILNFGKDNFIDDVPFEMGANCQKVEKNVFETTANMLRRKTPSKHGFLLISYTKNGREVELFTEKGKPEQEELMEMYMLLASNLM